jgi:hypothetical protein
MATVNDVTRIEEADPRLEDSDPGDHDRFAHYIVGRNPKSKITDAMVNGKPLRALCGKKWVPSRDASRYPVCPDCQAIKDRLLKKK